jgi:hypothetical protein
MTHLLGLGALLARFQREGAEVPPFLLGSPTRNLVR